MRRFISLQFLLLTSSILFSHIPPSLGAEVSSPSLAVTQNGFAFQLYCSGLQSSVPTNLAAVVPDTYCCSSSSSEWDACLQEHTNAVKGMEKFLSNYLNFCYMIPTIPMEGGCGNRNRFGQDGSSQNVTNLTCEIDQYKSIEAEMISCLKKTK